MESIANTIRGTLIRSVEDFEPLATKIIKDYCIICGAKKYRFAEIEFYYYDKNSETFNQEWNHKTYPRTEKEAGDLFFHYSGVDICFDSSFGKGHFGGILIRSLFDEEENRYITGPLLCANEILNSSSSKREWPRIVPVESLDCVVRKTKRYGISYSSSNKFDDKLCFFDNRLIENNNLRNTFENTFWDYQKQCPKKITRDYLKRFKDGE